VAIIDGVPKFSAADLLFKIGGVFERFRVRVDHEQERGMVAGREIAHRDFDVAIFELDGVLTDPQPFTLLRESGIRFVAPKTGRTP
jgi:hypothetical protein